MLLKFSENPVSIRLESDGSENFRRYVADTAQGRPIVPYLVAEQPHLITKAEPAIFLTFGTSSGASDHSHFVVYFLSPSRYHNQKIYKP